MSLRFSHSVSSLMSIDTPEKVKSMPTTPTMDENEKQSQKALTKCLEFQDFLDVQTRLVLLPRVESEGVGAVIASYQEIDHQKDEMKEPSSNNESQDTAEPSKENRDDEETGQDLSGYILIGMKSSPPEEDWKSKDFTSILATIREEKNSPIELQFESPINQSKIPSSQSQSQQPQSQATNETQQQEGNTSIQNKNDAQDSWSAFSAWGQRMKKQAAAAADSMAEAAKERMQVAKKMEHGSGRVQQRSCDIFLQTSVGAFIPVSNLKESKITTSSLLLVRKSATEALPGRGYSYQWYRSSKKIIPKPTDETASLSSSVSSQSTDTGECEWVVLDGSTHAAFQPNTTLVGRRLRCIVTMDQEEPMSSDSEDSDTDLSSVVGPVQEIIEIDHPIVGDLTLFNGARQALLKGTKFGVFTGQGNALNKQFSVEVAIGVGKVGHRQVPMSSVKIFLHSGDDTIVLTEEAIKEVSAEADPSQAKKFTLVLPFPPEEGSMLSSMCNDSNKLMVIAPNRMTRETFLMALGIANYHGKPANLSCKTLLYRDPLPKRESIEDGSISSESMPSTSIVSTPANLEASSEHPESDSLSVADPNMTVDPQDRIREDEMAALKKELDLVREKLARKDKVVSELQRQITKSDNSYNQIKQALHSCQDDLEKSKSENQQLSKALKITENVVEAHEAKSVQTKKEYSKKVSVLDGRISKQANEIVELEKANKVLQNEKAVLGAAVEARESKLVKMKQLQASFDDMTEQMKRQDALKLELEETKRRFEDAEKEIKKMEDAERQCRSDLKEAVAAVDELKAKIKGKEEKAASSLAKLEPLQKMNQQLKAERNSFKQKNDSLSKEISKLCRNGRTFTEIERTMANHQSLLQEVEMLRKQKRKALEDAHEYRTRYEQLKVAQEMAGMDNETRAALERNAELERLLAEMTEYVNAKEMQVDTLKQVNEHLQMEIHSLAQANLSKNEV